MCRRRRLGDGRKLRLQCTQMRAHSISGALWIVRLDHAQNLVVAALLARPKGSLDVLRGTNTTPVTDSTPTGSTTPSASATATTGG